MHTEEEMLEIKKDKDQLKLKYERLQNEFIDYKDKSQRLIISNEENYNKIFKENQTLKADLRMNKEKKEQEEITKTLKKSENDMNQYRKKSSMNLPNHMGVESSKMEYLKNITLKYLENIAIGNEFQTKILENVIFTVLNVSENEKYILEDKRLKSTFYYSWWYNAKSYISNKIYGQSFDDTFISKKMSSSSFERNDEIDGRSIRKENESNFINKENYSYNDLRNKVINEDVIIK